MGSISWVDVPAGYFSLTNSKTKQVPEIAVPSRCKSPGRSTILVGMSMIKIEETSGNLPAREHFCQMKDSFIILGKNLTRIDYRMELELHHTFTR